MVNSLFIVNIVSLSFSLRCCSRPYTLFFFSFFIALFTILRWPLNCSTSSLYPPSLYSLAHGVLPRLTLSLLTLLITSLLVTTTLLQRRSVVPPLDGVNPARSLLPSPQLLPPLLHQHQLLQQLPKQTPPHPPRPPVVAVPRRIRADTMVHRVKSVWPMQALTTAPSIIS